MISSELERKLRLLRLSGLARVFDVRLQPVRVNNFETLW